jgi:hypothetical protein
LSAKFKSGPFGTFLCLLLLSICAAGNSLCAELPAEMPMNELAGRGGWLIVTLKSETGEDLPMMVDTGTSDTMIDKSFEPRLGKPLDTEAFQSWGNKETLTVYSAPKLYLGGARLKISGSGIFTYDCKPLSSGAGRPIMGVLGMDVLENYCIQLDFAGGKVRFLDDRRADTKTWGKAFRIVPLNFRDRRPAVAENLFGAKGPHSLIDTGCDDDGWLMPKFYRQWTNQAVPPRRGETRSPVGMFGGEKYPFVSLHAADVESDGIGIRFLARHLVTLDFPQRTMYLLRQSAGPLPDPRLGATRMEVLDRMTQAVVDDDVAAARSELARLQHSDAPELAKIVARKLMAELESEPKPTPADVPSEVTKAALGDLRPRSAEVGWLKPAANRIPLNGQIVSPLLDSGKIHATGLYAHAPSRYVFDLGGKWNALRGEAGLHTAFQPYAFGVVFVIKTDGKEVFRSSIIRGTTQVSYDIDVTGVRTLELLVDKAYDKNGGDWGLWLDPTLFREARKNADGLH